jgi:hypothetical protein
LALCNKYILLIVIMLMLSVPAVGAAQEKPPALRPFAGLKLGGALHSVFSGLDPAAQVELEGGVSLLENRLDVALQVSWDRSAASGGAEDDRFDAGAVKWELDQDFLMIGLVARYRFLPMDKPYNAYAGAGPRVLLMRTVVNGTSGGEDLGENEQTETRFGAVLVAGGEYRLGPGDLLLELALGIGSLDGLITGQSSASALGVLLGYRLRF